MPQDIVNARASEIYVIAVTHDPSIKSTFAYRGTLALGVGTNPAVGGKLWQKQDDGDSTNWNLKADSVSVDEFKELIDCPHTYVGQAGKYVAVNALANGLEFVTPSGMATLPIVTVGTGGDYTDVNLAIDFLRSKNGGTLICIQDFYVYNNAMNKDITNITFKSKNPNLGTGSFIQFNGGSGVWSGNNVTFENFMFSTRNTYLGAAPFKALANSYWTFNNCRFGSSGAPATAKPLFNCDSKECYITFNNSQQVQTTKPFCINDANVTLNLYNGSLAAVTAINTLNKDSGSRLLGGTTVTENFIDKANGLAYTATNPAHWAIPLPTNAQNAIDRIAAAVVLLSGVPIP